MYTFFQKVILCSFLVTVLWGSSQPDKQSATEETAQVPASLIGRTWGALANMGSYVGVTTHALDRMPDLNLNELNRLFNQTHLKDLHIPELSGKVLTYILLDNGDSKGLRSIRIGSVKILYMDRTVTKFTAWQPNFPQHNNMPFLLGLLTNPMTSMFTKEEHGMFAEERSYRSGADKEIKMQQDVKSFLYTFEGVGKEGISYRITITLNKYLPTPEETSRFEKKELNIFAAPQQNS